jgi:hypothetical protein
MAAVDDLFVAMRRAEPWPLKPSEPPACSSNGQAKEAMASSG